jgi:serine/tyrosine/threonine adenylyltransferase
MQETPLAQQMLDWVIATHYPHLLATATNTATDSGTSGAEVRVARYRAFLREVAERTARMVAAWQLVGFTHGVLNTDNSAFRRTGTRPTPFCAPSPSRRRAGRRPVSVLGLTIDYGPFGFLDMYDPTFIPNTTGPSIRSSLGQPHSRPHSRHTQRTH